MSIVRYRTSNDFIPTSFDHLVGRFFNDSLSRAGGSTDPSFVPKVDIIEAENAFEIQLAVPGFEKEDFQIDLNDSKLSVSGERKFTKEKKENNLYRVETQYGNFSRSFTLPENVDATRITASYKNGILELIVPKDEKKLEKKSIKVS